MAAYSRVQSEPTVFSHLIRRMRAVEMDRAACPSVAWCARPSTPALANTDSSMTLGADDYTGKSMRTGYAQALKDYLFTPRPSVTGRDVNIAAPISF